MKNEDIQTLKAEARSMKLAYTSDTSAGYSRKDNGKGFTFFDNDGKRISDEGELLRLKKLAIPPAWRNVWICAKANGHLQATGIDVANRKQYKYHQQWSVLRNERKHDRILDFAKALPLIRKKVNEDILSPGFTKEKVVAMAITVMDKTFIRVGNEAYAKMYGHFGLTSLRNKHIKITGSNMVISFKGKKGVFQEVKVTHSRLANMMKKLKDIPGQELFQYYDEEGHKRTIDSGAVNEYIEMTTGKEFTAKDFRTWRGTVEAFAHLTALTEREQALPPEKNVIEALDYVASKLGNTRAVCKKYYVHPKLLNSYLEGELDGYLAKFSGERRQNANDVLDMEERFVMQFLEEESGRHIKTKAA